jgi:predicted nucleic acid-binding protein
MAIDTEGEKRQVVMLDNSAAVALVVEDHESHNATLEAVRGRRLGLAGHAWFEAYSVLTRLPAGLRRSPTDAVRILARNFPASGFLSETEAAALPEELARLGISGGAMYDALIGAAARQHRRPLVTRDARARPVYDALAVEVEFIL